MHTFSFFLCLEGALLPDSEEDNLLKGTINLFADTLNIIFISKVYLLV